MAEAALKEAPAAEEERELTDGFHLIIDALKLNGVKTIDAVPGIPITDFCAHVAGLGAFACSRSATSRTQATRRRSRVLQPSSRGTAPRRRRAASFLNGLHALAHATTNCFPMILISGSSEREIVTRTADDEEMDQLAIAKPLCKAADLILHAEIPASALRARSARRCRAVRWRLSSTRRRSCSAR